jgi:23S rRNA (cytidine1920-2'-O)/16S rRNA (cytidine1409-2'-O)-methyltransferase
MDIVAIDVSFISLDKILPAVIGWLKQDSWIVALVKPQFEAGRESVGRGGIVKDREVHRAVLLDTMAAAHELGLHAEGLIRSPIRGAKGNVEFLLALSYGSETAIVDPQSMVDAVLEATKE